MNVSFGFALGMGLCLICAACSGSNTGSTGGASGSAPGSGTGSSAAGNRTLDVCALVTGAESKTWLGGEALEPEPFKGPSGVADGTGCKYRSAEAKAGILLSVRDGAKYHGRIDSPANPGAVAVDRLGEDAYLYNGSVRFLQNDWSASVSSVEGNVADDKLIAMARLVSTRLP